MGKINHNPDKERIIELVTNWRERSRLNFGQMVRKIQIYGCDMSENALRDQLTGRAERTPNIPPELILAVIAAFTERLTDSERCRADEALEFVDIARLPLTRLKDLNQFFPEDELVQALNNYLPVPLTGRAPFSPAAIIIDFEPKVEVNRAGDRLLMPVEFSMPLYHNDIIHTYEHAQAIFLCETDRILFQVPEGKTQTVDCQNRPDGYVIGSIRALFDQRQTPAEAKSALQTLALSETAEICLLAQFYSGRKQWDQAIDRVQQLIKVQKKVSPYLLHHLGNLYFEAARYAKAEENYYAALIAFDAGTDKLARAAACLGLALTARALNDADQALKYLKTIMAGEYSAVEKKTRGEEPIRKTPTYQGKINLSGYVQFLVARLAPERLAKEIQNIPDGFLVRLDAMKGNFFLKTDASATANLGENTGFEAMELLAAVYITTQNLLETLSPLEIEHQAKTGHLPDTLRRQAEETARDAVGLTAQRAQTFAGHYADLVGSEPGILQLLIEQRSVGEE